jgi:hypothetical protein
MDVLIPIIHALLQDKGPHEAGDGEVDAVRMAHNAKQAVGPQMSGYGCIPHRQHLLHVLHVTGEKQVAPAPKEEYHRLVDNPVCGA